jgi:hypothetical protein
VEIALDAKNRAGILTRAAFVASETNPGGTNPPRVGKHLLEALLCRSVPMPSADAIAQFRYDDAKSTRGNFEALESNGKCAACHKMLNGPGFAFERFDPIGRVRMKEREHVVDATGTLLIDDTPRWFDGAADLSRALASSPEVERCVARRWLRFTLARKEDEGDRASWDRALSAMQLSGTGGGDLRAFLRSLVTSRTFRYRSLDEGESR